MNTPNYPEVLPLTTAAPPVAETIPSVLPVARPRSQPGNAWLRFGRGVLGWVWRLYAGALLCFTYSLQYLSFFTSILVVGWSYRWMQAVVLRGWWKQSPKARQGTFQEFCDSLGMDAPVPRPRWFLRERIVATMQQPGPGGHPPSGLRKFGRALTIPWHGLWLNFKTGLAGLFCTYLLTGWGCLLMWLSWEYGWDNSFNKGYERFLLGPVTGLLGSLLFVLAMFYVPMAQAHQAATGQARAFFDFRFVRRLVRARLTGYVGLAALTGLASLILGGLVLYTAAPDFGGNTVATAQEGLAYLQVYLFWCSLFLFPLFLLLRFVAAVLYRSAVFKVLRQGTVTRAELNPVLAGWLDRLELKLIPQAETTGLGWYATLTARFAYRRVLFTVLFFLWVAFVARFYAFYFLRANAVVGFLNHPMIQLPCFDYIPDHLYLGRNE